MTVLPALVRELRRRDPLMSISVRRQSCPELIAAVAEGRLDPAMVKLPVSEARMQRLDLGRAVVVAMRRDDPLAALDGVAPRTSARKLVTIGAVPPTGQAVLAAFASAGMSPSSSLPMVGVGPICRMMANGDGLAAVNRMLSAGYVDEIKLAMRPFIPTQTEVFTLIGHAEGSAA